MFKPEVGNYSIVSHERNDVRNGGNGHDIEVLARLLSIAQRFDKLECNSRTAQIVKSFACNLWVNHYTIGYFLLRFVVVCDNGVNADRFKIFHLFNRRNAGIYGDNEAWRVVGKDSLQRVHAYAVAVFVAVGDKIKHVEFVAQVQHKSRYCANAVAVVVTVNKHFFLICDCLLYAFDGFLHTVYFKR